MTINVRAAAAALLGISAAFLWASTAAAQAYAGREEAHNVRLVGFHDLAARTAYQPTIKQQGHDIPPINEVIYVNASPGVPQERFARLVGAFTKAFENPELIAQQKKINVIVTPMNSAQLRSAVQKAFDLANEYKPILTE